MFTRNQELYDFNSNDYNNKEKKTNTFQTDRRQWDKTKTMLNLEFPDQEKILMNKKRYEEYLFKLHVNNQIMKMASKKDQKEEKMEKLEDGFSIYVNGAHKKNEKYTPRYTVTKSSESSKKNVNFNPNVHMVTHSNYNQLRANHYNTSSKSNAFETKERKKWGNSSFIIKTTEGYEIKINAPNSKLEPISKSEPVKCPSDNLYYSDDFESESESENKDSCQKVNGPSSDTNLIQTVKFSDSEDSEDEIFKTDKNIVVDLSRREIKTLRDSLFIFENSNLKESQAEIDTDSEIESEDMSDSRDKKSQFVTSFGNDEKDSESEIEEKIEEEHDSSSETCKMILNQVANLKLEDRMNLVKFLTNVDCNSKMDRKNKSK
ncbi:hypothetical protein BpHYR1_036635 [Brachionus plicatilis]|uniref:Uncharacterized protein n=1 Tax=Brachionus plicatilis TaxID=10195 RepID=A0A3M7SNB0_BRAPC|nr:hypothetical protein BpHYR1_036635 [Brachionus plicatilis]